MCQALWRALHCVLIAIIQEYEVTVTLPELFDHVRELICPNLHS